MVALCDLQVSVLNIVSLIMVLSMTKNIMMKNSETKKKIRAKDMLNLIRAVSDRALRAFTSVRIALLEI